MLFRSLLKTRIIITAYVFEGAKGEHTVAWEAELHRRNKTYIHGSIGVEAGGGGGVTFTDVQTRYKYGDSTTEAAQRRIIAYRERSQVVHISAGIPRMSIHILRGGSTCVTGCCHSEMSANYVIATEARTHDSDTSPVRMPSSSAKDILPTCRHTCRYYLFACQGLSTG